MGLHRCSCGQRSKGNSQCSGPRGFDGSTCCASGVKNLGQGLTYGARFECRKICPNGCEIRCFESSHDHTLLRTSAGSQGAQRSVSVAARSAVGRMRKLDGCISSNTLRGETLRHYDEPSVTVEVLANREPPGGFIGRHGAEASV